MGLRIRTRSSGAGLPVIACTVALLLRGGPVAVAQTPEPAIELEAYSGFAPGQFSYRAHSWVPLRVTVKNTLRPVKGELIVERQQRKGMNQLTRYSRKVDLPRNSQKVFSFTVWLGKDEKELSIRLRSNRRNLVSSTIPLMSTLDDREMILVLSKTYAPYRIFWQINPRTRSERSLPERYTIPVRPDSLPDKWLGLSAVSAIIAERDVYMRLTGSQRRALKRYAHMGGNLILSEGGPEAGIREEITDAFYPVEIGDGYIDVRPAFLCNYGAALADIGNLSLLKCRPRPDAIAVMEQDGLPVVTRKRCGLGTVTFVAFDLKAPVLKNLPGRKFFVEDVLGEQNRPVFMNDYAYFQGQEQQLPRLGQGMGTGPRLQLEKAIRKNSMKKIPSVWTIAGLLSIYILMAAPLNYLVFKSIGRLELAWAALPVISIGFAAFGLTAGLPGSGRELVVNGVGVIECGTDSPVGAVSQVVGIYSPNHGDYELTMSRTNALPVHPRSGTGHRGLEQKVLTLDWTSGSPIAGINIHAHSQRFLESDGVVDLVGGIRAKLTWNGDTVSGRIQNDTAYNLRACVLVCLGRTMKLGDLMESGSVDIGSAEGPAPNWRGLIKNTWRGLPSPNGGFEQQTLEALTAHLNWQRRRLGPAFLVGRIDRLVHPVSAHRRSVTMNGFTAFVARLPLELAPGRYRLQGLLINRKLVQSNSPRIEQGRSPWRQGSEEYGIWRFRLPLEYRHAKPSKVLLTNDSTGKRTDTWFDNALYREGDRFDYLVCRRLYRTSTAKTVWSGAKPEWSVLEDTQTDPWWRDRLAKPELAVLVDVPGKDG